MPSEIRDSYSIRFREGENAGFIVMGATSASTSPEKLMELLSANVESRLRAIQDVEVFALSGLEELQVSVTLDQASMLSYGITIVDVNTAFQAGLSPQPLGTLRESGTRYSVRFNRDERDLAALPRLEIKRIGDTLVSLDDISDIDIRYSIPSRVFMIEDQPAIQISLTPVEGGNLNRMTEELQIIMNAARDAGQLPEDTEFDLYVDPAKYINRSINQVIKAALIGGALAILIVFLILGEPRNTLIIALSLPVSIMLSFILMYVFGVSLNLISLGGFALAVGMIVDSTIVVMENIHRWRREDKRVLNSAMWKHIVMDATRQVRAPVIASTLTSVLVFLPLSFSAPLANAILGDQARTVVFSLMCSLFVSLSLVPVIAYFLFRGTGKQNIDHLSARGFARLSEPIVGAVIRGYRRILRFIISRRSIAALFLMCTLVAMVIAVVTLFPKIPKEIMSKPQSDRVVLFFRHTDYESSVDIIEKLMPELRERVAASLVGAPIPQLRQHIGPLQPAAPRFRESGAGQRGDRAAGTGLRQRGTLVLQHPVLGSGRPSAAPGLRASAERLRAGFDPEGSHTGRYAADSQRIEAVRQGLRPSFAGHEQRAHPEPQERGPQRLSKPQRLILDQALARRALGGTVSMNISDGTYEVPVCRRIPGYRAGYQRQAGQFPDSLEGFLPALQAFLRFRDSSPAFRRYIPRTASWPSGCTPVMTADITDAERLQKEQDAKKLFAEKLVLPPGYSYSFDNPRLEIDDSIRSLFVAMGISILLIYLLLCFQFNSLWIPLIILVTIPLGFVGVVISLYIFGSTLNLNSLLGTILLGGIVVNNAIIMIDFYLNSRKDHPDHLSAIEATAGLRFQPILITTLTTIFGMMPIAIGFGSGSSILQPLGIAVSGGLVLSSFLTLFAIPAILSFWRYNP